MLKKSEQVALRREQRFAMGLCILCGKRQHMDGHRGCVECLEKQILRQRRVRAAKVDVQQLAFTDTETRTGSEVWA